jgi:cytochrome c-type biogenesis protein CcmE
VIIAGALATFGLAIGLMLYAMRGAVALFKSPSEVAQEHIEPGTRLRIGGLVLTGSEDKTATALTFAVTDGAHNLPVDCAGECYGGIPDLFREGQGVVAEGVLEPGGRLRADQILAKHDERYMPREVVEALKKQGRWQEGQQEGQK